MADYFAHTGSQSDRSDWESLEDHLHLVSKYAQKFAAKFDAAEWGRILGLWHDLGKYSNEFQSYLSKSGGADVHQSEVYGKVDHSTAGAIFADQLTSLPIHVKRALAFPIAGHHSGLANGIQPGKQKPLGERLKKKIADWASAPSEILQCPQLAYSERLHRSFQDYMGLGSQGSRLTSFTWAFYVRMLFSCLVDADFLATEAFMTPEASAERPRYSTTFQQLLVCLNAEFERLNDGRSGVVHLARQEILVACNQAASQPPGLFSLTVPTGGGKTLAGLSFALRHIVANPANAFDRIIVAIPFTSIIEQSAQVYRKVFSSIDEEIVLECHSNLEPEQETTLSRLASQNFDAPIVVTTNIQLFESLFANRTAKCRKLHNIARSVIILDEAQTLPVTLLEPTLLAIQELVRNYGCTIVLCTATQPVIIRSDEFTIGLSNVTEIIPEPAQLYERMRRVQVQYIGKTDIGALVERLSTHSQFLCIHNTRRQANETFSMLAEMTGNSGLFHLSTFMCPRHREKVLKIIRQRLFDKEPCRVVSTQLIEAGVDVDFPVVYRAIAGLDSIAQAAGRCNREGTHATGDVFVFSLPEKPPPGFLRSTAQTTENLLDRFANDLIAPEAIKEYFRTHYWWHKEQWDEKGILPLHLDSRRGEIEFAEIADKYRIIEDASVRVLVPYGRGKKLIQRLRSADPLKRPLSRTERMQIERYSVGLYEDAVKAALGKDFESVYDGQYIILQNESMYDERLGIDLTKLGKHNAGELIV